MISIHLCRLTDGEWCRVERYHVGHGFDTMAHAVEYAEALNARTWPRFNWLSEPVEAYLAMRAKDRFSTCEVDVGGGASEQKR